MCTVGLLIGIVAVGYHTSWSTRTRNANTTCEISWKARVHVVVDVLALGLDVGVIVKI